MKITILTLFPEMFTGPFDYSIVKRAVDKKIVSIDIVNIRDFATDKHKSVDDHPYGGGVGMIVRVDVVDRAINAVKSEKSTIILLDPGGIPYSQSTARNLATKNHLILVCGHYEGVDQRIRKLVDMELSIGRYILTGGEIPAMVVTDSVVRLIPGVLKKEVATKLESFSREGILEYPQYTKPQTYRGMGVPEILRSGDHKNIATWRDNQAVLRSKRVRSASLKHLPNGK